MIHDSDFNRLATTENVEFFLTTSLLLDPQVRWSRSALTWTDGCTSTRRSAWAWTSCTTCSFPLTHTSFSTSSPSDTSLVGIQQKRNDTMKVLKAAFSCFNLHDFSFSCRSGFWFYMITLHRKWDTVATEATHSRKIVRNIETLSCKTMSRLSQRCGIFTFPTRASQQLLRSLHQLVTSH